MLSLGALAFAAPWALAALVALPALWWLLRVTPPAPRRLDFPAIRLLLGLEGREDAAAHTPWWVLVLRLLIALLVILAAAHPLLNPSGPPARGDGPLVLVIDDGWAAARDWNERRAAMSTILAGAERAERPVMILTTAAPADGGPPEPGTLMSAVQARAMVQALDPKPWPGDRGAALAAVKALPRDRVTQAIWVADGIEDGNGIALANALQSLGGGLEILMGRSGRVLLPPREDANREQITVTVRRQPAGAPAERLVVRGVDGQGKVLGREEASLAAGQAEIGIPLRLPGELRNRLTRIDIENEAGAASVALLDHNWRRRPVGLSGGEAGGAPLLAQLYYVERALEDSADLHRGEISELLATDMAVLVLADVPAILGTTAEKLTRWVESGGVLVRFAGPLLAHAANTGGGNDSFLPVRLRDGDRTLGGAMSWTTPQGLAPFAAEGPFAGLPTPAEVRVNAQVLAEPTLDLAERTWARLSDGTPLVTGNRHGRGWVILIHTSANAAWSNLALSGLFVDMLKRLVGLSEGRMGEHAGVALPPIELLDGFGRLHAPSAAAIALTGDADKLVPGPRHPPGFYGETGSRLALNLGPHVPALKPLAPPQGAAVSPLSGRPVEVDAQPALLTAALILALLDLVVALWLRSLLRRGAVAGLALAAMLAPSHGRAAESFALEAGLATRLAYVRTGDTATDLKSQAGLRGLSRVIGQRSTAALAEPMGVELDSDPVLFFPLLYWPITPGQKLLPPPVVEKLNAYMQAGGLILMDTGAQADTAGPAETERLHAITQGLTIPPLAPVSEEHVLARSFYLLKDMPGRFEGAMWVAAGQGPANDGVSPVLVGGNDWAGAWAVDERGRPLYAVIPGGERQREMAYRVGVNVVMYALTGNYKADQVHLPAIMERLGR